MNIPHPLISAIIPKRSPVDDSVRLAETSIAGQKFVETETIVVPDAAGRGANWARNRGWEKARGEYLLFSDCDIRWVPWALSTLLDALHRDPLASYAYCGFRWENPDGSARIVGLGPFTPEQVRQTSCFSTMSLFRAKDFPGFDESLRRLQDWDLYLTLLERDGRLGACVPAVLFSTPARPGISHGDAEVAWKDAETIVKQKHGLIQ